MTKWRAIVDRIENGCAVLIPEGRPSVRLLVHRELLPPGIRDGSLLRFRIELEPEAAAGRRREIAELQEELEASPPSETQKWFPSAPSEKEMGPDGEKRSPKQ